MWRLCFKTYEKTALSSKSSYSLYFFKQCSLLTEFTWIPSQPTHIQLFPKTHMERILLITINLQDILIDISSSVKRGGVKLWVGYAWFNKLCPGTFLCHNAPINHPNTPCCALISSLTPFHVCVWELNVWVLPRYQINASSEPLPSLYWTPKYCNELTLTDKEEGTHLKGNIITFGVKRNQKTCNCISVRSYMTSE